MGEKRRIINKILKTVRWSEFRGKPRYKCERTEIQRCAVFGGLLRGGYEKWLWQEIDCNFMVSLRYRDCFIWKIGCSSCQQDDQNLLFQLSPYKLKESRFPQAAELRRWIRVVDRVVTFDEIDIRYALLFFLHQENVRLVRVHNRGTAVTDTFAGRSACVDPC